MLFETLIVEYHLLADVVELTIRRDTRAAPLISVALADPIDLDVFQIVRRIVQIVAYARHRTYLTRIG